MRPADEIKQKRKFLRHSFLTFGIPVAVGSVWAFDAYHNIYFAIYVVTVAFVLAYLWCEVMWKYYVKDLLRGRHENEGHG